MLRKSSLLAKDTLDLVASSLVSMSRKRDWRMRELAARGALAFAPFADTTESKDALVQICVELMQDRVGSVRLTAAECLCCTALLDLDDEGQPAPPPGATPDAEETNHGEAEDADTWRDSAVVPRLYDLMQRPTARQRVLGLYMVQVLVPIRVLPEDVVVGLLLPLVLNATEDYLPNVRLGAARALMTMVSILPRISAPPSASPASDAHTHTNMLNGVLGHANLERCLERLCGDSDIDVRQFARSAAAVLDVWRSMTKGSAVQ